MLFRKDIEPRCTYCRYAAPAEPETVICRKKGVRSAGDHCRSCLLYTSDAADDS